MRYFTRGWANGELADAESEQVALDYRARLNEIAPRLPKELLELAQRINLHDAIIDHVWWEPSRRRLTLKLICIKSDPDTHEAVELVYDDAMLGPRRIESLRRAALSRDTELLFDEVDIDEEGTFTHRILFWPSEEVTIDFGSLALATRPVADRRVSLMAAFREIED